MYHITEQNDEFTYTKQLRKKKTLLVVDGWYLSNVVLYTALLGILAGCLNI